MSSTKVKEITRPILRWAGSKRKLLSKLLACAPKHFDRYIEPFLGSACYFLALHPPKAILGDFNADLMDMYSVLRNYPKEIAEIVHDMPDTDDFYYSLRARSSKELGSIERAARFIYLNRYCFNGVYRSNLRGEFNVPRGKHTGNIPSIDEFINCAKALKFADLRNGDFENCLSDVGVGDFIYVDPPYASVSRLSHGEYGYGSFNEKDINRFVYSLKEADKNGAVILLSYAYTPILKQMLPNWHHRKIVVKRHVAGFNHHRNEVQELIISNKSLPTNLDTI
jgi:DNA adenine methylase